VESSTLVPLRDADDPATLAAVYGSTMDRLRREIAGRPLIAAVGARLRVVVADRHGPPRARPWRYGLPVPGGTIMLVCVADAVVDGGRS